MANVAHSALTRTHGIHVLHAFEFADAAARLAATPAAGDVGKIARQADTGRFYLLIDDSPLTWAVIGPVLGNEALSGVKALTLNGAVPHGPMGATETIDFTAGQFHTGTLDANCTLSFTLPAAPQFVTLIITQGVGPFSIVWPATAKFQGASAPILSQGGGDKDVFHGFFDGTNVHLALAIRGSA
jgi:hypothetical protein